jgi:hypothetical protein|eukprot:COSAG03_NODE_1664_length_3699_cov_2.498889_6_plen_101_part_00
MIIGTETSAPEQVSDYFDQLQALGAAKDSTLAALKEQVALAHLYTLGKAVIGTGGLANTDEHAKQIMHLLVSPSVLFKEWWWCVCARACQPFETIRATGR